MSIREDPKNKDVLYVGTDLGVYVSNDGGKKWQVLWPISCRRRLFLIW